MDLPQVMHEALKGFTPTEEQQEAALRAAMEAGERFLVGALAHVLDHEEQEQLRNAALEVWTLYVGVSTSKLLPEEIREQLPPLYSQEENPDPLVVCKFFTPDSNWTWYGYEFDGLDVFFGLVIGFETELGYFTLHELEEARGPLGLPIERDEHFTPMKLSEVRALHPLQAAPPVPAVSLPALSMYVITEEDLAALAWDKGFLVISVYRDDLVEGLGATPEQIVLLSNADMESIANLVGEAYVHSGSFFEDVRQAVNQTLKEKGGKEIPARQDTAYPVTSVCREDLTEIDVSDEHIALLTDEDMTVIAGLMEDLYCDHDFWDDLAHAVGVVLKKKGVISPLADAVPIIVPLAPSDEAQDR